MWEIENIASYIGSEILLLLPLIVIENLHLPLLPFIIVTSILSLSNTLAFALLFFDIKKMFDITFWVTVCYPLVVIALFPFSLFSFALTIGLFLAGFVYSLVDTGSKISKTKTGKEEINIEERELKEGKKYPLYPIAMLVLRQNQYNRRMVQTKSYKYYVLSIMLLSMVIRFFPPYQVLHYVGLGLVFFVGLLIGGHVRYNMFRKAS